MKRFTLAAVVAAAMALCTSAVMHAGKPPDYTVTTKTYKLTPPRGTNFPNASGSLTISIAGPIHDRYYTYYYNVTFFVQVWGLAPNRGYGVSPSKDASTGYYYVAGCTTDADGNGSGSRTWRYGSPHGVPNTYSVVDLTTGVVELSN